MSTFINPTELELQEETVIAINRISKATTGGRRMRFNSIVCVGDGKCHIGIGFGKANEVASAVNKAKENAKKEKRLVKLLIRLARKEKEKACRNRQPRRPLHP